MGIEPHMPGFDELVCESLKKIYDNDNIEIVNKAVGGKNVAWGVENVDVVTQENADLVVLCWGMNDCTGNHIRFGTAMDTMIKKIKSKNPECAILLVSSTYPDGSISAHFLSRLLYGDHRPRKGRARSRRSRKGISESLSRDERQIQRACLSHRRRRPTRLRRRGNRLRRNKKER